MRWTVLAVALALAGCAAQRQAEAQAAMQSAIKTCNDEIPRRVGKYVLWAACVNAASEHFAPGDPAGPLIRATRMALAVKVDEGRVTSDEARVELARVAFDAHQQVSRTQATEDQARAANVAAFLPLLQQNRAPVLVPYQMPVQQPWSASCMRVGNMVNCSGQ